MCADEIVLADELSLKLPLMPMSGLCSEHLADHLTPTFATAL
jgi:hypothetical protein